MRKGKFFVDRADVNDFAARFRRHAVFYKRLGDEKQSFQVDVEHRVEIRFRHVPEIRAALESGIVHKDVDLAELRSSVGDEFLSFNGTADVVLKPRDAAASLLNTRNDFVRAGLVRSVAERYFCSFFRK